VLPVERTLAELDRGILKSKKFSLYQGEVVNLENNYFVSVSHNKFFLFVGLNGLDLLYCTKRVVLTSFFPLYIIAH